MKVMEIRYSDSLFNSCDNFNLGSLTVRSIKFWYKKDYLSIFMRISGFLRKLFVNNRLCF